VVKREMVMEVRSKRNSRMNAVTQQTSGDKIAIRPLQVNVPETNIAKLRSRIDATQWPDPETVADDHGDGYGQPAAAITSAVLGRTVSGHPAGDLTRDDVLDDFTLYWLTNTAVPAARFYWESHINLYNAADVPSRLR